MKKICQFCKIEFDTDTKEMSKYCSWDCRAIDQIAKNLKRKEDRRWQKWILHKDIPIDKQPAWIKCVYREFDDKKSKVVSHRGSKCKICGFDRFINVCHLIPKRYGGRITNENIIILCPNHHWALDHRVLNLKEKQKLIKVIEKEYSNSKYILHFLDVKTYELPRKNMYLK